MQSPASLGLQPRDVSLFSATTGPGKQRATIAAREGRLLFRSEACQAIVSADRAFLFPARQTISRKSAVTSRHLFLGYLNMRGHYATL